MRVHLFHTSDWHLGQLFHQHGRQVEHAHFLDWLLGQLAERQPDALLIAGDVFDVINPPAQAQKQLYQFLADAHAACPHLQILMIAGNHDSGYRIEQVDPLLAQFNTRAVGVIQWLPDRTLDTSRLIVPIHSREGQVVAWCVVLPFLRPAEITGTAMGTDPAQAMHGIHQYLIELARSRKTPEQALIVMSHAHVQGGETSESERAIIIGNEEALPHQIYGDAVDYVALGHLHKPQQVGAAHIRYSGAPIPLSFSEVAYPHQVLDVQIDRTASPMLQLTPLIIPRRVQLYRITGSLPSVFEQLADLPDNGPRPLDERDFVQVEYSTDAPPPLDLRQQIEKALPSEQYRLVRVVRQQIARSVTLQAVRTLEPPTPWQLFEQEWQKKQYQDDPQVRRDFMQIVAEAEQRQQGDLAG